MTSINAAGGATQANFEFDPIEMERLEDIDPNLAAHVDNVEQAYQERMDDLAQQIEDTDDPRRTLDLQGAMRELERDFGEFHDQIESACADFETNADILEGFDEVMPFMDLSGQVDGRVSEAAAALGEDIIDALDGFQEVIAESYAEYGTATVSGEVEAQSPPICPVEPQVARDISDNPDVMGDYQADGAAGAPDVASMEHEGKTIDELVDLLQNDPEAFRDAMSELDAEERAATMSLVQNQLQEVNQLFNMMTQFSQAMHDTSKAIIQNLRV